MSPSTDPVARNIAIITTILIALMVLEYIYSFKDEIRLVWPRFRKSIEAKIFVMTRYAGLAGQSFNIWFAFRIASGVPNSPFACKVWTSYQIATIQCLLLSVESLLMLRVYKMYNKGKYISVLLFILVSAQSTTMAVNARWIITETRYSPTCVPHYHSRTYVGVSIITTFVFIVVAMLWRFLKSPSGWSEVPRAWLKLAVRDGGCTAIAITVILIFMFLCTTGVIDTQMSGNIVFYVLLSCLWFAAGRIVLHQEKFRIIQESQKKGGVNDPSRWTEMIEVNLDDISPFDDPDVCPTSPSGSEVESTKVSTLSTLSAAGMKDIADEHL